MQPARIMVLLLALGVPAAPAASSTPSHDPTSAVGTFAVAFSGTSTLHDFEGTAEPKPLTVRRDDGGTWAATATLPVAALGTGNRWRDANLRSMLESERHPEITATFAAVDPDRCRPSGPGRPGELPFTLRIRNVERSLIATTSGWQEGPDHVSFDAGFRVSLAAFALEPPTALGLSKVGDVVDVSVHVELRHGDAR